MTTSREYQITDLVKPFEAVNKSTPASTLGNALPQVRSSHSAVYVFDKKDTFLGMVSPYKSLYASNYPYTTKVSSILFKPPMITEKAPLYEVAEHMIATKVYSLPVFDDKGDIVGVIDGKDILKKVNTDSDLLEFISEMTSPNRPITAHINSSVNDVYHKLKVRGISRILLVDDEDDLAGIVTRADLMHAFIKPTSKMRFASAGAYTGFYTLAGEKKFRTDDQVRQYASMMVDTLSDKTPMKKIVSRLISSSHNSIVLVNKDNKPTGFLSTRDLLQAITLLRPEKEVPLIMKKPSGSVKSKEFETAREYLTDFGRKMTKRIAIEKIEITTDEPKNGKGQTTDFNTTVIVTPVAGKQFIAAVTQKHYLDSIQEATKIIEKQQRRKDTPRAMTHAPGI